MAIDQTNLRITLANQAANACQQYLQAVSRLRDLAARRPFLGDFTDAELLAAGLKNLDAGTIGQVFDFVIPSITTNLADAGNGGRNIQILQQVAQGV